MIKMILKILIK